jgi:3',5'-cyclic AMP phosphodiesterase CpdA
LGTPTPGADWRGNHRQSLAAGAAYIIAFSTTADAPLWKKQVKCYPLETGNRRKHVRHPSSGILVVAHSGLSGPGVVERATHDRFVSIDITVPDLQVEAAIGIGTNPGLKLDRCPLAAEIRKRHQVSRIAFLTFREIDLFHGVLLPTKNIE